MDPPAEVPLGQGPEGAAEPAANNPEAGSPGQQQQQPAQQQQQPAQPQQGDKRPHESAQVAPLTLQQGPPPAKKRRAQQQQREQRQWAPEALAAARTVLRAGMARLGAGAAQADGGGTPSVPSMPDAPSTPGASLHELNTFFIHNWPHLASTIFNRSLKQALREAQASGLVVDAAAAPAAAAAAAGKRQLARFQLSRAGAAALPPVGYMAALAAYCQQFPDAAAFHADLRARTATAPPPAAPPGGSRERSEPKAGAPSDMCGFFSSLPQHAQPKAQQAGSAPPPVPAGVTRLGPPAPSGGDAQATRRCVLLGCVSLLLLHRPGVHEASLRAWLVGQLAQRQPGWAALLSSADGGRAATLAMGLLQAAASNCQEGWLCAAQRDGACYYYSCSSYAPAPPGDAELAAALGELAAAAVAGWRSGLQRLKTATAAEASAAGAPSEALAAAAAVAAYDAVVAAEAKERAGAAQPGAPRPNSRTMQTSRKSTGGRAPRMQLKEKEEGEQELKEQGEQEMK